MRLITNSVESKNLPIVDVAFFGQPFYYDFGVQTTQYLQRGVLYHRKFGVFLTPSQTEDHVIFGSYNLGLKSHRFDNEIALVLWGAKAAATKAQQWQRDIVQAAKVSISMVME